MLVLSWTGHFRLQIILLAAIAICANLTRYPGIVLIPIGCLYVFSLNDAALFKKVLKAVLWGVITSVPLAIWLIRNYFLSHTFTGERVEAD
jgi:ABC-type glycerol-3-phosphate transport system permease component